MSVRNVEFDQLLLNISTVLKSPLSDSNKPQPGQSNRSGWTIKSKATLLGKNLQEKWTHGTYYAPMHTAQIWQDGSTSVRTPWLLQTMTMRRCSFVALTSRTYSWYCSTLRNIHLRMYAKHAKGVNSLLNSDDDSTMIDYSTSILIAMIVIELSQMLVGMAFLLSHMRGCLEVVRLQPLPAELWPPSQGQVHESLLGKLAPWLKHGTFLGQQGFWLDVLDCIMMFPW